MGGSEAVRHDRHRGAPLVGFLELAALCGLAIAQPVLGVYGNNPDQFTQRRVEGLEIVAFAAVLALVPPLVLFAIELVVGWTLGQRVARLLHIGLVAALVGLLSLEIVNHMGDGQVGAWAIFAGVVGGLVSIPLYARVRPAREWLRVLSPAPVIFAALFLFTSPTGDLLFADPIQALELEREPAGPAQLPDIVVVVFDELPVVSLLDGTGQIDAELYPGFARLAGDATWYRNTTTVHDNTLFAVPAALSGKFPALKTVSANPQNHPQTIFTLLGSEYEMDVWERIPLCPTNLCPPIGSTSGFGDMLGEASDVLGENVNGDLSGPPSVNSEWRIDDPEDQRDLFRSFVEKLEDSDGPDLHFLHVVLPHSPFELVPSGRVYDRPEQAFGMAELARWANPTLADLARRRHVLQLQYADRELQRLIEKLETQGRYDDTLVAVVADHGTALTSQHTTRDFTPETANEIAWVPMMIKSPGQREPVLSDVPAQTLDLLPTMAADIGVRIPWTTQGVPLAGTEPIDRTERYFADFYNGLELNIHRVTIDETEYAKVLAWPKIRDREGLAPELRPYLTGVHDELVGRAINELDPGPPGDAVLDLIAGAPTVTIGPDDPIPLWCDGAVRGGPVETVVVAVNGTIGAVVPLTDYDGVDQRLSTIVPEPLLHDGANKIRFYALDPTGDGVTLTELAVA